MVEAFFSANKTGRAIFAFASNYSQGWEHFSTNEQVAGISKSREEKSDNGQRPSHGKTDRDRGDCVFNSEAVVAVAVPCGCRVCIADNFYKYQQHMYSSFLRDNCTLDKPSFKEEERHS